MSLLGIVGIMVACMVGGAVLVAISRLAKLMVGGITRLGMGSVNCLRSAPSNQSFCESKTVSVPVTEGRLLPPRSGAHRGMGTGDALPDGYIEPVLEPVGTLPDPGVQVTNDDRLSVFARMYAAHQNGLAFRPQSQVDSIVCLSGLIDELFLRVPGGYCFGSDAALGAGELAFGRVYKGDRPPPAHPTRVEIRLETTVRLLR